MKILGKTPSICEYPVVLLKGECQIQRFLSQKIQNAETQMGSCPQNHLGND